MFQDKLERNWFILVTLAVFGMIAFGWLFLEEISEVMGEKWPLTHLSAFQLVLIGLLAMFTWERRRLSDPQPWWKAPYLIWGIVGVGFFFLGFDEECKIHETLDHYIHKFFKIQETALTDRIDDAIILVYGLIGIVALYLFRSELKKHLLRQTPLYAGIGLVFVMVLLDTLTNRDDLVSNPGVLETLSIIEDSLKVYAEFLFVIVFYRTYKAYLQEP